MIYNTYSHCQIESVISQISEEYKGHKIEIRESGKFYKKLDENTINPENIFKCVDNLDIINGYFYKTLDQTTDLEGLQNYFNNLSKEDKDEYLENVCSVIYREKNYDYQEFSSESMHGMSIRKVLKLPSVARNFIKLVSDNLKNSLRK